MLNSELSNLEASSRLKKRPILYYSLAAHFYPTSQYIFPINLKGRYFFNPFLPISNLRTELTCSCLLVSSRVGTGSQFFWIQNSSRFTLLYWDLLLLIMNQGNFSLLDNLAVTLSCISHFCILLLVSAFFYFSLRTLNCGKLSLTSFLHLEVIVTHPHNGEEINTWHTAPERYANHSVHIAVWFSPYMNPVADVLLLLFETWKLKHRQVV